MSDIDKHPAAAVGWISLAVLARDILGVRSRSLGRSGRDWCQARGVPYRRDGKFNWARIADVRRAIEAAGAPAANDRADAVAEAVAKLQRAG